MLKKESLWSRAARPVVSWLNFGKAKFPVEQKKVSPSDISATAVRMLAQSSDQTIRARAATLVGRFRASDPDKLKLIAEKRKVVLSGTPDLKAGHEIAQKTCLVCHKLHGE